MTAAVPSLALPLDIPAEGTMIPSANDAAATPTPDLNVSFAGCTRLSRMRSLLPVIFMLGFTIATPSSIIPYLQQNTFGNNVFLTTGFLAAAKGVLGFAYAPIIGSFSDTFCRKYVLIVTLSLNLIPYISYLATGNYWYYAATNVLFGLYDPTMAVLMAAVADLFRRDCREHTENFAVASAVFFLGVGLAPFLGAFLSTTVTFILCVAFLASMILGVAFFLPRFDTTTTTAAPLQPSGNVLTVGVVNDNDEPQPSERSALLPQPDVVSGDAPQPSATAFVAQTAEIVAPVKANAASRTLVALRLYKDLRLTILLLFFNSLAEQMLDKLLLQYLQNNLNFGATKQAIVIAILGFGGVFGMVIVTTLLKRHSGPLRALQVALIANVVICSLYSFVTAPWAVYLTTAFSIVGMGVYPCACALAARCVSPDAMGVAQGCAAAARMAAAGVAPLLFGYIFQDTQSTAFPGIAFLVAAGCVAVAGVMTTFLSRAVEH